MKSLVHAFGRWYVARVNRQEWSSQSFTKLYERPLEYAFALQCISDAAPKHILDVGAGRSPWPALMRTCGSMVTAIDQVSDYWGGEGMHNRHYHVAGDDILNPTIEGPFDMVTCISVLEHIEEHEIAVANMFDLLRPGGHLVLTVPHSTDGYVGNVYELEDSGYGRDFNYVCQVFSPDEVALWASKNGAEIVRQDFYRIFTGRLWTVGERQHPYERVDPDALHQLTAIDMRKRVKPVV